jgi:membrane dipeptidase
MNDNIRQAREQALAILKPSQKELEHGLALHAQSLVIESYGFSPPAAIDGDAVRAALEAGASDFEIQDMLEEVPMTRCAFDPVERAECLDAWEAAGVTCILQNAGEEVQSIPQVLKRLARFTFATDLMRDRVFHAVTPDDIVAAKRSGRHCLYMSSNAVPLAERWASKEEELGFIRIFFQLGIRMMHLTYNRRNMIGDGCNETANAGLSDFGRAVVAEMNRVGVIVDCAHSGWQTCLDAAKVSNKPVVVSHSACWSLNQHRRCKSDEVIKAVADTGGYIGIACLAPFLGRSENIAAMLDHIDHVVKKFGPDHVTIGTDVAYKSSRIDAEMKKLPARRKSRPRWENFWPSDDAIFDPKYKDWPDRSMAWTNWPIFTVGMVQRGYSDADIQKIIGGNVLRVVRACWPKELQQP